MSNSEQASKRKRRSKVLPVVEAAGLSLSLATTASAVPGGPAVNLPTSGNGDGNQVFLGEEEIADVSLATFYVFDKEGDGTSSMVELVGHGCRGCHGCGCHHGCGGCHAHRGCGGCHHGCGCHGCGGCHHGCGGCGCVSIGLGFGGWGGCGGCGGCSGGYWCWINGVRTWCPYPYGY
jgi:hypothetical protein